MERPNKWVAIGAIATAVIAITGIVKSVPMKTLTIVVFIAIALPLLAVAIITFYILFTDVLSKIKGFIKRIAIENKEDFNILRRYVSIISTITLIITILIYSSIKDLPDAKKVNQTVKRVGNKIAAKNMASLSSSMDSIIHTIIGHQKDPDATRIRVYEDALRQAADRGYVFHIPQENYYITAIDRRNDESLLTEEERKRIKKSLDDILKRTDKQDQISLMKEVLSAIRVKEELWKPKERKVTLSEIDIVGIVGGYIGELILKY